LAQRGISSNPGYEPKTNGREPKYSRKSSNPQSEESRWIIKRSLPKGFALVAFSIFISIFGSGLVVSYFSRWWRKQ